MNTGSEKILVVDDDDTIRDVVSKMLCRLGFEVSKCFAGSVLKFHQLIAARLD
jgi:CheY-like chemotaxis protein